MTYAEEIRSKIDAVEREGMALWKKITSNSKDYMEALQINEADLRVIERSLGQLTGFDLDGERFVLSVRNVCARDYGADWEYRVIAACESNASLNEKTGHGTALINAVSDEWHQKIVNHLKEKD